MPVFNKVINNSFVWHLMNTNFLQKSWFNTRQKKLFRNRLKIIAKIDLNKNGFNKKITNL